MKITIIIPTYNERENIEKLLPILLGKVGALPVSASIGGEIKGQGAFRHYKAI